MSKTSRYLVNSSEFNARAFGLSSAVGMAQVKTVSMIARLNISATIAAKKYKACARVGGDAHFKALTDTVLTVQALHGVLTDLEAVADRLVQIKEKQHLTPTARAEAAKAPRVSAQVFSGYSHKPKSVREFLEISPEFEIDTKTKRDIEAPRKREKKLKQAQLSKPIKSISHVDAGAVDLSDLV
jgi:hypothetical protein